MNEGGTMAVPQFAITGTCTGTGIRLLAEQTAVAMEARVAAAATQLGGRLVRMLFVSGSCSVVAIFELPHGVAPAVLSLSLFASGMVEPGAEIVRLMDCAEVDAALP